ncbi:hypothetical protein CF651_10000 [Paenibacillus rigui]|uniref:Transglutaminase-like domain-containing protein n=2 Tax=Paenibacillus rigui TaxID=554312 RepID=A0A229UUE7_9BACL|nr:hypothetical protein CF651_10000 [Paenibacillus rigui]
MFVADRQQLLWFVGMTLLYLVVLQLVFDVDMSFGLLQASGAGLLLQGLLQVDRGARWKREAGDATAAAALASAARAAQGTGQPANETAWQGEHLPSLTYQRTSGRTHTPRARETKGWSPFAVSLVWTAIVLAGAWLGAGQHPVQGAAVPTEAYVSHWEDRWPLSLWTQQPYPAAAKTGYGTDDSRLGSPLTADETVAFTARTTKLTYWRGDAKTFYTGQGWTTPEARLTSFEELKPAQGTDLSAEVMPQSSNPALDPWTPVVQEVTLMQKNLNRQLFLGGKLARVESLVSEQGKPVPAAWIWRNSMSDQYQLPAMADPVASYKVQVFAWSGGSAGPQGMSSGQVLAEPNLETYLQLPPSLPSRVKELAEQITKDQTSSYDKAAAIERYLSSNYAYSLNGSQPPRNGQDLVDQFLFEQKAGYCDHFSSAMVVMLRSVGVPARWVKGFAPGEVIATEWAASESSPSPSDPSVTSAASAGSVPSAATAVSDAPKTAATDTPSASNSTSTIYTVEVRNRDAHSWVEAYLPSLGWVPFEATPGYGSAASGPKGETGVSTQAGKETAASLQPASPATAPLGFAQLFAEGWLLIPTLRAGIADLFTSISAGPEVFHRWLVWMRPWLPLSLWIAAALLAGVLIHLWRIIRRTADSMASTERSAGQPRSSLGALRTYTVVRSADQLWGKLQKKWGRAEPSQTMREYALTRTFADDTQRGAVLRIIQLLEAIRYREGRAHVSRRQLREAWDAMKRTL